ncbi:MAG TPA: Xaa-Pro peptidase family protein [Candidatus Limnocylindria bacterium]|nr:Xaa-Pro peptidase family protein [Candidatus Limnocylindria bacterium]
MTVAAALGGRLERSRAILDTVDADALLISRPALRRWLAGFVLHRGEETTSGYSGTLLVSRGAQLVLVDGRYHEQAQASCPEWDVRLTHGPIATELRALAAELGISRVAAEAKVLSHADWLAIAVAGLELQPADDPLRDLRMVKGADEIAAISRACALTDACFEHMLTFLHPGLSEHAVAWELQAWFRANGAEDLAFDPLVLVGARAAMPHGHPGDTAIAAGQPLLIDFGCQVDGYRSDMTRTVFFGEPERETRRRYDAVRQAQQLAFEAAAPGIIGSALDGIARNHLAEMGLGEAFTHGLGHGIGLETHEEPILRHWQQPLQAGMVVTLEPGVYFPGEVGIRIEDDILLTDGGATWLTRSPRELVVL